MTKTKIYAKIKTMFTGIIEEVGEILSITYDKITIKCVTVLEDTKLGDSIAVNGVCLTVTKLLEQGFVADVSPQTLKVTTLSKLQNKTPVNLERAMKADGRFGGHMVSGHIDGLGKISDIINNGQFYDFKIELNPEQSKYVIKKGSIAINGISLTIAGVNGNIIDIAVIPHTYNKTSLQNLKNGDYVNIEVDMTAKYIEKFLSTSDNKSKISLEFLQEHGF